MRFAYEIKNANSSHVSLDFFSTADITDEKSKIAVLKMNWTRADSGRPWIFGGITILAINKEVGRLLRNMASPLKNVIPANDSPLKLVMEMAADGARQVVYDDRLKKFRNVTTMKEGEDTWSAVGIKNIVVNATDEESAINRVKKLVTNAMMENPKAAAELAGWFSAGCKVSKLVSGKLPDVIGREALAGPGEAELAKKPVVIRVQKKMIKLGNEKTGMSGINKEKSKG